MMRLRRGSLFCADGYGGSEATSDSRGVQRANAGQRTEMARTFEEQMLDKAPDTVLVHFKADPKAIGAILQHSQYCKFGWLQTRARNFNLKTLACPRS
jgi:hypothetical protein